jgi:hypothetical protein
MSPVRRSCHKYASRADEIVRVREKELNGGAYYKLRPAAEALGEKYQAGATRL